LTGKGSGLILADLTGTGETSSVEDDKFKGGNLGKFHTLARAELWLGRTMMGEWIKDLRLLADFSLTDLRASSIMIYAEKETGLAALFCTAIENQKIRELTLRDIPLSYIFDTREGVDFFPLAVHVPGLLNWGDVSLANALTGLKVNIINPVSMSGRKITGDVLREYTTEFEKFRKLCGSSGMTTFSNKN